MKRRHTSLAAPIAILAILLLLPALYVGGYYAALDCEILNLSFQKDYGPHSDVTNASGPKYVVLGPPTYRVGGEFAAAFFYPAHVADRHFIRPGCWFDISYSEPTGGLW